MALLRPCLGLPGDPCGIPTTGSRCPKHRRAEERRHHNRDYDTPAWRRVRARTLAAWRAAHGDWCPGDGGEHGPHNVIPPDVLTLDHTEGVAAGVLGPRRVLCRYYNGVLGGRATPR